MRPRLALLFHAMFLITNKTRRYLQVFKLAAVDISILTAYTAISLTDFIHYHVLKVTLLHAYYMSMFCM